MARWHLYLFTVFLLLDSELEWGGRPRPAARSYTATLTWEKLREEREGPGFLDGGTGSPGPHVEPPLTSA